MNEPLSKKLVSVVSPAFNEEKNIPILFDRIIKVIPPDYDLEIIIVENGSTDNSLQILRQLHKTDRRLNYISLSRNFGHQGAITAGLDYAQGNVVIMLDADLQHPPEIIPQMIKLWEEGYNVVNTKKIYSRQTSWFRVIANKIFYRILKYLSGIELEGRSDFRLIDRKALTALKNLPERKRFLRGLSNWIGFKQTTINYEVQERYSGISKFNLKQLFGLAFDGIFSFSKVPLRIFTITGLIISLLSFSYFIYLLSYFVYNHISQAKNNWFPPGWASIVSSIMFLGGIQLVGIGLLGEYIGRIFDEVKQRPIYIVAESSFDNEKQDR